jgi:CRISPR type IV-associated protein Csf2
METKEKTQNIRLDGKIVLLSSLSHIGESTGPDSFLSEDIIIGPDGQPVECFLYSGNSYRGILRDMSAKYFLDKLGGIAVPLETFHLLFSGGSLGGPQSVDLDQARMYRRNIPVLSVFGGGVGNQILTGKIKIGAMYPLVAECQRVLPAELRDPNAPSWRQWTFEKSFTRMDDAKNENLRKYLNAPGQDALPVAQPTLELKEREELPAPEDKKKRKKDDPPQQMRYTIEMFAAGSVLYQRIDLCDMTDLEIGAFVSALVEFGGHPYIGGRSGIGSGLCEVEYSWRYAGEKESAGKFLKIDSDSLWLSALAGDAKDKYDDYLIKLYDQYLENKADELMLLLASGKK